MTPAWAEAELEALARLGVARDVLDRMLTGQIDAAPDVVVALADVLAAAARRLSSARVPA